MPSNYVSCVCCNKSFEPHLMVKCSICKKSFKHSCVDITANEVRILNANKGCDWTCMHCRKFGNEIKDLKAIILKLQEDIQTLRAENSEPKTSIINDAQFEEIVNEVNERSKRKKNIILFGVKEDDQEKPAAARFENDKQEVQNIVHAISPDLNVDDIKPIRLGHFTAGRKRPIKITLHEEHQVTKLIRKGFLLKNNNSYKDISLAMDRTPRQQEYYKNVKSQLIARQAEGERNLKIKHVNGVPKIIQSN